MKPTTKKPQTDMGGAVDKNFNKTMKTMGIPNKYLTEVDNPLNEKELSLKKKIFSLDKMEMLVHSDPKLSVVYDNMAEDGKERYGYHWNETIMNIIFNDYVLNSPKYLQKYKNTRSTKKKTRRDQSGINKLKSEFEDETPKTEGWSPTGEPQANPMISGATPVDTTNETTTAGGAGGASGSVGYATPYAWSRSGKTNNNIIKQTGWPMAMVESNYLLNPKGFIDYVKTINESADVDDKRLNKVLKKYVELTKDNRKPTRKEKEEFFNEYSKFLDDYVETNVDKDNIKAIKENDMDNNMMEHHLNTKVDKINFICNNMKNLPNLKTSLMKLSDSDVDKVYRKLENKLAVLNETTSSLIDTPADSMSNRNNPLGDNTSNIEKGLNLNEDHLFTKEDRINFICNVLDKHSDLFSIDSETARDVLTNSTDKEVENKYFEIETILKSNGIDPHTVVIEMELDEYKKLNKMLGGVIENRKPSALVLRDRVGNDNIKNFKKDLNHSGTKDIIDIEKELQYNKMQTEVKDPKKFGRDIEKKSLDKTKGVALKNVGNSSNIKGDEVNKRNITKTEKEEQDLMRLNAGDFIFDNEPDKRFEERMKNDMGEENYKQRQKKIEIRKNMPMYNKDKQPVKNMNEMNTIKSKIESFNEDVAITGKYVDVLNKNVIVDFYLNNVKEARTVNENWFKLDFGGFGNTYTKDFTLNENVSDMLDRYTYYVDAETTNVYAVKGDSKLNESKSTYKTKSINEGLEKMMKLSNYNPKSYTDTKNIKKSRGF